MGFDRRTLNLTVPNPAATIEETFNLRSDYIRPLGYKILLTGTDTAVKLRITDADSRIVYLDAADKDYKTAAVISQLATDDVVTGVAGLSADSTGVLSAVAQINSTSVIKNPIKVAIVNGGTAGDTIAFSLDYEYGVFGANTFTMPTASGTVSTFTTSLKSKYAQVLGFRALSVGTSTTERIRIKDADGKIVFLDAGDIDYDTATVDKVLFLDTTTTGLTPVTRNQTGVVTQAGIGRLDLPLVRSPLTVDLTSAEGNDEVVTMTIYYKTA
jgi:hypothetical protein